MHTQTPLSVAGGDKEIATSADPHALPRRPRLIFFQFAYGAGVPAFLRLHRLEHVKCLRQFFEVTVIRHDCDYQDICDRYEPDLALFETGVEIRDARRLDIRNPRRNPQVPKLALLHADGCSELRPAILSDLAAWDIHACFTISCCAHEHMEPIAKQLFLWPNFIDPSIHRDYGLRKAIPIMLSGSVNARYPWRRQVFKQVASRYATMAVQHRGYSAGQSSAQLYGVPYARIINASRVAPTCGSITRELVRKHLEIPGSKACLVTEETPAVRAAGFEDMVNCVFADGRDVVDKLAYLFQHPDTLDEVVANGYDLVHARHTIGARAQIFDWYNLNRSRRQFDRIVQRSPFGPLALVDEASPIQNVILHSGAIHLQRLQGGRDAVAGSAPRAARKLFQEVIEYLPEFPEAKLGMAMCALALGDAQEALSWIRETLRCSLLRYRSETPDPKEWATLIVCLLCLGKVKSAKRRATQFAELQHPELDLVRRTVALLTTSQAQTSAAASMAGASPSIHPTASSLLPEFLRSLAELLRRCDQSDLARRCETHSAALSSIATTPTSNPSGTTREGERRIPLEIAKRRWRRRPTLSGFDDPLLRQRLGARVQHKWVAWKAWLRQAHTGAGTRTGERAHDGFAAAIQDLLTSTAVQSALLVSAPNLKSELHWAETIGHAEQRLRLYTTAQYNAKLVRSAAARFAKKCLSRISERDAAEQVAGIKKAALVTRFDLVVVAAEGIDVEPTHRQLLDEVCTARLVVIDSVDSRYGQVLFDGLLAMGTFQLVRSGTAAGCTYAVLRWSESWQVNEPASYYGAHAL